MWENNISNTYRSSYVWGLNPRSISYTFSTTLHTGNVSHITIGSQRLHPGWDSNLRPLRHCATGTLTLPSRLRGHPIINFAQSFHQLRLGSLFGLLISVDARCFGSDGYWCHQSWQLILAAVSALARSYITAQVIKHCYLGLGTSRERRTRRRRNDPKGGEINSPKMIMSGGTNNG